MQTQPSRDYTARRAGYARWVKRLEDSFPDRFWAKVDRKLESECWLWLGSRSKFGYGRVRSSGTPHTVQASRIAYQLHYGAIDPALDVCHTCDNPPCCNPHHLFQGTRSDNILDSVNKGRWFIPVGEKNGRAIFSETQVLEIRRLFAGGHTMNALAAQFGVQHHNIWQIVRRIRWQHI